MDYKKELKIPERHTFKQVGKQTRSFKQSDVIYTRSYEEHDSNNELIANYEIQEVEYVGGDKTYHYYKKFNSEGKEIDNGQLESIL